MWGRAVRSRASSADPAAAQSASDTPPKPESEAEESHAEAVPRLRGELESDPDNPGLNYKPGNHLRLSGQRQAALKQFERSLEQLEADA